MSDDLKNFKISDAVNRPVDRPRGGSSPADAAEVPSVGFPTIEGLVDAEETDFTGFGERHAALVEMSNTGGSMKEKANAKKAAIAYEKTQDLLEHLLSTKAAMQGGDEEES